jgi:hypothetical protein
VAVHRLASLHHARSSTRHPDRPSAVPRTVGGLSGDLDLVALLAVDVPRPEVAVVGDERARPAISTWPGCSGNTIVVRGATPVKNSYWAANDSAEPTTSV